MSSLLGAPFQMINMTSEILFILDNRLREQADTNEVPEFISTEIFESVAGKMFEATNSFFTPRSLLMVEEHKGFFRSCLEHELLRMTEDSFEKLFQVATMGVKVQILQCNTLADIVSVSEDKLREVRDILQSRKMREEVTRLKDNFLGFYSSLSAGETIRLRHTLLNFFRRMRYPVAALIIEGYQTENGELTVSVHGQNSANLGATVLYNPGGTIADEYVLPIAGKSESSPRLYDGPWNLFSHRKDLVHETSRGILSNDTSTPSDSLPSEAAIPRTPEFIDRNDTRFLIDSELVEDMVLTPKYKKSPEFHSDLSNVSYADRLRANKLVWSPHQDDTSEFAAFN